MSGEVGRAEEAGQVLKGCLPFRLNIGLKILYLFCSSEKFSRAINVYPVEESPRDPEKGRVQIFRLNSKLDQQIASLDTTRSFSATTFNFKFSNFQISQIQSCRLHLLPVCTSKNLLSLDCQLERVCTGCKAPVWFAMSFHLHRQEITFFHSR